MEYKTQLFGGQANLYCMKQMSHNAKSNSHGCIRLVICTAAAFAVVILTTCSDGNDTKSLRSSDEAIREHHGLLIILQQNGKVSIQTLVKIVNKWRVLDDSVISCISHNVVRKVHSCPFTVCYELNSSIRIELCHTVMSKQHTLHGLFYLGEQASPHVGGEELQQAVKEAQPSFASLDDPPIYNKGNKQAVLEYCLLLLQKSAKQGIHGEEGLLAFIKEKHLYFKSFLQYLPGFADDDTDDIRRNTKHYCREIFRAADRKDLSHKDAMIYLSMRANHRLLRNAQVAIEDLNSDRVKDEHTMHVYLLVMMQPFMTMNDLSVNVSSDKDETDLYKIADTLPEKMDGLAKKLYLDKQRLSDMPMLMMKIYVTRL